MYVYRYDVGAGVQSAEENAQYDSRLRRGVERSEGTTPEGAEAERNYTGAGSAKIELARECAKTILYVSTAHDSAKT